MGLEKVPLPQKRRNWVAKMTNYDPDLTIMFKVMSANSTSI